MNNNRYIQIAILILLAVVVFFVVKDRPNNTNNQNNETTQPTPPPPTANPDVIVDLPQPNALVTSPVQVKGRAMNTWFFEANIPVTIKDSNNNIVVQKGFHSTTDWMIPGYVEFDETLTFTMPTTQYGTLIISKDNPSGLPINDASFSVPISFW